MKRAKKSSKAEAVGRSGQTDCSPCFAWMQELRMSMQRFVKIRGEMQNKLSGEEYHYFFRYIPDGNKAHLFVGEEQQVRKLAKNMAKKWNVSSWRLVPMPRWNFVYSGAPAFRDDSLCLLRHPSENAPDQARALPSPEDGCSTPLHGIGRCTMHPSPFYCGSRTDDGRCGAAPFHDREACEHLSNTGDKAMLNKQQISELKIRECEGQWVAGWWDDRFSPSSASGDMGFYSDTPEDAVKALLNYVLDNDKTQPTSAAR